MIMYSTCMPNMGIIRYHRSVLFNLFLFSLKGNAIEDGVGKKELEKLCNHPGRCIIKLVIM